MHETEKELIYIVNQYSEKLHSAAKDYSPAVIAQYVYDVAKEYNRFYAEVSIFSEADIEKRKFRVGLSALAAQTIKVSMGLMSIHVPDRM